MNGVDPTKCGRCGREPASMIHINTNLEAWHHFVKVRVVDARPDRGKLYWFLAGVALAGAAFAAFARLVTP